MLNHETEGLENFIYIKEMHQTAFHASSLLFLVASLSLCVRHTFRRVAPCCCPLAGWRLHIFFYTRWRMFHFITVKRQILMPHFGIFSHLIFLCGANFLDSYHEEILSAAFFKISGAVYSNCNHPAPWQPAHTSEFYIGSSTWVIQLNSISGVMSHFLTNQR